MAFKKNGDEEGLFCMQIYIFVFPMGERKWMYKIYLVRGPPANLENYKIQDWRKDDEEYTNKGVCFK